jgi:hypothetical protein
MSFVARLERIRAEIEAARALSVPSSVLVVDESVPVGRSVVRESPVVRRARERNLPPGGTAPIVSSGGDA